MQKVLGFCSYLKLLSSFIFLEIYSQQSFARLLFKVYNYCYVSWCDNWYELNDVNTWSQTIGPVPMNQHWPKARSSEENSWSDSFYCVRIIIILVGIENRDHHSIFFLLFMFPIKYVTPIGHVAFMYCNLVSLQQELFINIWALNSRS